MIDLVALAAASAGLSKPLTKLIEALASMMGTVSRPVLLLLTEHAEGRAKLVREHYSQQLALLRGRAPQLPASSPPALPARTGEDALVTAQAAEATALAAQSMATHQQQKRYANVMTVVAEAADQLPSDVSDSPIDDDWVARFFTAAQDISSEQLQRIWGFLLAREVATPGSVPLRTLETLRNLTREEAVLTQRLASMLTVTGTYVMAEGVGLTPSEIATLVDCDILDVSALFVSWSHDPDAVPAPPGVLPSQPGIARYQYPSGHVLVMRAPKNIFKIDARRVRPSASELIRVIGAPTDVEYLRALTERIATQEYFSGTELLQPAMAVPTP